MSPSVRFVLRDKGLIREKIVKKVESSMKTGKRTSMVNREKCWFCRVIFCYLSGEPVDLCAQRLFTVSLIKICSYGYGAGMIRRTLKFKLY